MQTLFVKLVCFLAFLFACSFAAASTHNNLMPQLQLFLTPAFSDSTQAFSFLGEVGEKNLRGSATYGVSFGSCQRLKLSGEYLTQDLKYRFLTNHKRAWVSQAGVGGVYECLFARSIFQSIDTGFSYSHAFNRHLGKREISIQDQEFLLNRHVAGSDAFLSYLGTTISLWHCAFLSAAGNYDHVTYHRKFQHRAHAEGAGGSAKFTQQFGKEFNLALEAEWRKPFNFFQAVLNWNRLYDSWGITCGLYGNYTKGKEHLPNVAIAGLQLGFTFGGETENCCRTFAYSDSSLSNCTDRLFCNLANWVSKPAIYSPIVLAISDPQALALATAGCALPTSTAIPDQSFPSRGGTYSFDTSVFFDGSGLTITFSATGLPAGSSIDPVSGVISGPTGGPGSSTEVTVTATTSCGSTSQSFRLSFR